MRLAPFLAALLLILSAAMPVVARGSALTLTQDWVDRQQPVEQQSPNFFFNNCNGNPSNPACDPSTWVTNPTQCSWDVDDRQSLVGTGSVVAGSTTTASLCTVADGLTSFGHYDRVQVEVIAKTGLVVTLGSSSGSLWTLSPRPFGRSQIWSLCLIELTPGPYPVVAGSNGGTGISVTYTLSITAAPKTVRDVAAVMQVGLGIHSIECPPVERT